jgi:hypothetical protein
MAVTYEMIQKSTLTSAVASVTFTAISNIYTDLVIIANVQGQANGCNMQIWFNDDGSSTNYSSSVLYSTGSVVGAGRSANQAKINFGTNGGMPFSDSNQFGLNIYNIQNYSNTTTYKTIFGTARNLNNGYTGAPEFTQAVGMWRNTAAISSISIGVDNSKTMQIGSSFTIYGIKAA